MAIRENNMAGERKVLTTVLMAAACILLAVLTGWMLFEGVLSGQAATIFETAMLMIEISLLLLTARLMPLQCPLEIKLLRQGALWVFAAQIVTERLGWGLFCPLSMAVLVMICTVLGFALYRERMKYSLHLLTAFWCILLGCLSVCVLLTVFAGGTFPDTALQTSSLHSGMTNLTLFGHSGEAVACFLAAGAGILLMQCLSVQGWFWKLMTVVLLPIYLVVLLLEDCIPAFLALAVMVAFLLGEQTQRWLRKKLGRLRRIILTLLVIAVVFVGSLGGMMIAGERLHPSQSAQTASTEPETVSVPEASEAMDPEADAETASDGDPQPALKGMALDGQDTAPAETPVEAPTSLARKNWQEIPGELSNYPQGALFGFADSPDSVPTHDLPLHQLWQGGLPLLLMTVALMLGLIYRMVLVFFSADDAIPGKSRLLAGLLAGLTVPALSMPLMEEDYLLAALLFAFFAGVFLRYCEENAVTLPKGKERKKSKYYRPQRLQRKTPAPASAPKKRTAEKVQEVPVEEEEEDDYLPDWLKEEQPEVELHFAAPDFGTGEEPEEVTINPVRRRPVKRRKTEQPNEPVSVPSEPVSAPEEPTPTAAEPVPAEAESAPAPEEFAPIPETAEESSAEAEENPSDEEEHPD